MNTVDQTIERFSAPSEKLVEPAIAIQKIVEWKRQGLRIAIADGVSHLPLYLQAEYFRLCANYGDRFLVRLNSDELEAKDSACSHPSISWEMRALHAAHYPYLDLITKRNTEDIAWLREYDPDILVKCVTKNAAIAHEIESIRHHVSALGIQLVVMDESLQIISLERTPSIESPNTAINAFESIAEAYAERIDQKPHNAYYERPATLSLLPSVNGLNVLDAGCGPGVYTQWLMEYGANVTAVDGSPTMVELAQRRIGPKAKIFCADLNEPLFMPDESFDVIISTLTLDYIENWEKIFQDFFRILRKPGYFIFSINHPIGELKRATSVNYFNLEKVYRQWLDFGTPVTLPSYRRPLAQLINPLIHAGFTLDCLLEPQPQEHFQQELPAEYERLQKQPGFLCIRAIK